MELKLKTKQIFLSVICFLFLHIEFHAQTSVAFAAKAAAIDKAVDSGLKKFDGILDKQQRELFVNASNLIGILKTQFSDLFSDVERTLTKKQIEVFNDLSRLELELASVLNDNVDQISNVALDLQNTITRLPFTKRFPTPTEIDIPVFTHQQEGAFSVTIKGINLKNKNNYIVLNGVKYQNPITPSVKENQYNFVLTKEDVFKDSINTMEIHLFKRKFLFGTKEYVYTVSYNVLPKQIAQVKVYYELEGTRREYTGEFRQVVAKTPGSCSWSENPTNVNRRSSDRKIDLATVRIRKDRSARGGGRCYFHRNNSNEFSIRARATARRCCNPFNCGTGRTECSVFWKEFKDVPDFKTKTVAHDLFFDTQEVIELPKETSKYIKAEIAFFNGKKVTIDSPVFEKYFVKFSYDAARKQVFIAFKPSIE